MSYEILNAIQKRLESLHAQSMELIELNRMDHPACAPLEPETADWKRGMADGARAVFKVIGHAPLLFYTPSLTKQEMGL